MNFPSVTIDPWEWPGYDGRNQELLCNVHHTTRPTKLGKRVGVSEKAMDVLQELEDAGFRVYHIDEELSHDGYDKYGPESDIWSLTITTFQCIQNTLKPVCLRFGWENWFGPKCAESPYEFHEQSTPTKRAMMAMMELL